MYLSTIYKYFFLIFRDKCCLHPCHKNITLQHRKISTENHKLSIYRRIEPNVHWRQPQNISVVNAQGTLRKRVRKRGAIGSASLLVTLYLIITSEIIPLKSQNDYPNMIWKRDTTMKTADCLEETIEGWNHTQIITGNLAKLEWVIWFTTEKRIQVFCLVPNSQNWEHSLK